jgi:hypothetical protein
VSSLPTVSRVTQSQLNRFDRQVGLPVAWKVLRSRLSFAASLRVFCWYALYSLRDPLRDAPSDGWPEDLEPLVRHQLRAAVRLDDSVQKVAGLTEAARLEHVREVIAETGARFIGSSVPLPGAAAWQAASVGERERFAGETAKSFINAKTQNVSVTDEAISFEVCECRFVQLTRLMGRSHLASMFCEADSVHFSSPESLVHLRRNSTLAQGASACDFRFEFRR